LSNLFLRGCYERVAAKPEDTTMYKFLQLLAVLLFALMVCPLAAEETWYDSPSVSIMTGFIYEPLKP